MTTLAIFPMVIIKEAIQAKGQLCHDNADRFGHKRSKSMTPSVVYTARDYSQVYCGKKPIVAHVGFSYMRRWNVSCGCYIDIDGGLVFPG